MWVTQTIGPVTAAHMQMRSLHPLAICAINEVKESGRGERCHSGRKWREESNILPQMLCCFQFSVTSVGLISKAAMIRKNGGFVSWHNRKGYPLLVSGVPPDAFSETGQLWGRLSQNLPM
ncbi:hypothetical protein V2J09_004352 [Rumex salicifolius]